ncbi:hypothetical protein AWJ14_00660 [Hoeflea olei]|uniref:Uncharacterized protein n=1 Tax=Hoeflea olei TaxID=1480615 RepID=A0A1C1YZ72_9HYPH|nr:hypothetical protein AWJ14_00660 [Hoeflea olei]
MEEQDRAVPAEPAERTAKSGQFQQDRCLWEAISQAATARLARMAATRQAPAHLKAAAAAAAAAKVVMAS